VNQIPNNQTACSSGCDCHSGMDRREFLRMAGAGTAALFAARGAVMAGPFATADFEKLVPADKKLHPDWLKSLFARGGRTVYRGDDLKFIGMPVGGVGTGQLYLGGDGKLWHWDIFNQHIGTGADHYAHPMQPKSPLEHGFALRITAGGQTQTRALDRSGFADVSFCGEYPLATVEYRDAASPVAVSLEAFSPFIPLNEDDSSLPATVLRFTLKNTSNEAVEATLTGWLQNAVCLFNPWQEGTRRNRIERGDGFSFLNCSAEKPPASAQPARPDIVFEDSNQDTYEGWTTTGTAFGSGPIKRAAIPGYQGDVGGEGERVVNSHASAPGSEVGARDAHTGKLTSRRFTIERNFINFWIGGGAHKGKTCLNLIVDGKVVSSATGANDNRMSLKSFAVRAHMGKEAFIEIVDAESGAWGNVGVGRITFSDRPTMESELEQMSDYGTMGLALLGEPAEHALAAAEKGGFGGRGGNDATTPLNEPLIGAIGRKLRLSPGQVATVDFVLTWHFPNLEIQGLGKVGRYYATKFASALAVAGHVAGNFTRLVAQTRLWHDTWYDSTLPFWFLDRTFLNTSILASSTCYRLTDGRFYGWEGVGCCPGTCTHVWHYAHAVARLFPALERSAREMADYDAGFDAATGRIRFRAEYNNHWAVDGQAGCILRAYREHQMSADDQFLRRLWPRVKKSLEFLIERDAGADGIMDGPQHNTLDADWFGQIAWLSSLYIAALRAGEVMATAMGEAEFAAKARAIADAGSKNIREKLFDGEYFINRIDPQHLEAINSGSGCEIDQVFGQSWAFQVHLGRVLPEHETHSALRALWKYNFTPDVGPYRAAHKPGRWYAMAGEAGLLICTFPRADWDYVKASGKGPEWAAGYFNECMNGFEYQVAGHMVWEGMVMEGLAITRAVHDRYHAARRNPWNEVECGDHYARSMASYGVFLAACGFEYDGPQGYLGFAPRLAPENFKAAFTAAEGWGTYAQQVQGNRMQAQIQLKWGRLQVRTIAVEWLDKARPTSVRLIVNGRAAEATHATADNRLTITLANGVSLAAGENIEVAIT